MKAQRHNQPAGARSQRVAPALLVAFLAAGCAAESGAPGTAGEPGANAPEVELASWNDTASKWTLLDFVRGVTDASGASFVPVAERIAVFDLDGTLVIERPDYLEVVAAVFVLRQRLASDPSLGDKQPFTAVSGNDMGYIRSNADEVILAAADGQTLSTYHDEVRRMFEGETHEPTGRLYAGLFYRPMIELIELFLEHEFHVYVASDSQQEYIRAFSVDCLHVPPQRVIGSMVAFALAPQGQSFSFQRTDTWWEPHVDGAGKAERIRERVGATPIFAAGNSGGDQQMLEVAAVSGHALLVNHDDGQREFDYSHADILQQATSSGWQVVSMKADWATIYADTCVLH